MSRRPGIGSSYLITHGDWHRIDFKNYTQVNGYKNRLPRFYKERLFSSYRRTAMAVDAVSLSDDAYRDAVEQLSRHHSDPEYYYYERIYAMYIRATTKLNE